MYFKSSLKNSLKTESAAKIWRGGSKSGSDIQEAHDIVFHIRILNCEYLNILIEINRRFLTFVSAIYIQDK